MEFEHKGHSSLERLLENKLDTGDFNGNIDEVRSFKNGKKDVHINYQIKKAKYGAEGILEYNEVDELFKDDESGFVSQLVNDFNIRNIVIKEDNNIKKIINLEDNN